MTCPVARHAMQPRRAVVGRLCGDCVAGILRDVRAAAALHDELIEPGQRGMTQRVSGTPRRCVPYNDRASGARSRIAGVLASWAALIVDERPAVPPGVEVGALAAFVAFHASWLAAHDLAEHAVTELHDLAWGDAWQAAYGDPGGPKRVERIADCPIDVGAGTRCAARLKATIRPEGAMRASEIVCEEGHAWDVGHWLTLAGDAPRARLTTDEASVALYGDASWGDAVRQHVRRGKLRRGNDGLIPCEDVLALYRDMQEGAA